MIQHTRFSGWSLISLIILIFLFTSSVFAQVEHVVPPPKITSSQQVSERLPHSQFIWQSDVLPSKQKLNSTDENILTVSEEAPVPFTGLAIGWKAEGTQLRPSDFQLEIRTRTTGKPWGSWIKTHGYLAPGDSPSGLFWAILYVTPDGMAHDNYEVKIKLPENTVITYLKISAADARYDGETAKVKELPKEKQSTMPDILPRKKWWGSLPDDQLQPDYSPTQINITHALVHHTVTANEPPDPEQVIRQIWDWHVNDNGWLDIGYNFLLDHEGNIYQGRYNPWLESSDIQGAHAGSANSSSVGLAVLGQFEPGASPQVGDPTAATLDGLAKVISWRFDQNNIDPMDNNWLAVNSGGSEKLPVISGHRDVSGTACPGENLYNVLDTVRKDVQAGEDKQVVDDVPFELKQNYPNPFQNRTTIPFTLEERSNVTINLYNIKKQKVREVYSEDDVEPGEYDIPFNASGLSSGAYFYELTANGQSSIKLMILIR